MVDTHELDPGVVIINEKLIRTAVTARYLFAMIDGTNKNGDIAQQLLEGGVYPNLNTSAASLSQMTRKINALATVLWGVPLVVKDTVQSAYSCNAELAGQFIEIRSALLPMDMSEVDPTLFMDELQTEKYERNDDRFLYFNSMVEGITESLRDVEQSDELLLGIGDTAIFLPKTSLVQIYASAGGERAISFGGALDEEQTRSLMLSQSKAKALNEATYGLVGRQLIDVTKTGSQGKLRLQFEIDHDALALLAQFGIERAKLPKIDFEPEDVEALEAVVSVANDFINGKLRELGFVNSMSLRDSLVIREMLESCDFKEPTLTTRRNQLLTMINRRLVLWSVIRKNDLGYYNLLKGIVVEGRPEKGACEGTDPELFYPAQGESTREAKEVCHGCGSREACLEYAITGKEKFGIWGGLSERDRRRIRRQRRSQNKPGTSVDVSIRDNRDDLGADQTLVS